MQILIVIIEKDENQYIGRCPNLLEVSVEGDTRDGDNCTKKCQTSLFCSPQIDVLSELFYNNRRQSTVTNLGDLL